MEDDLQMSEESPYLSVHGHGHIDNFAITGNSVQPAACAHCCRVLSPDNPMNGDHDLCGDCKFLCTENLENPMYDVPLRRISRRRRRRRRRTSRYRSSESIEDLFSQQFSQMISLTWQNHSTSYEHEEQHIDGDTSVRSWQQNSSHSTPSGSRRCHLVLSDTESDRFGNMDSLYGESEFNFSFSHYHAYHGESDAVSMSTYGGDSDASVDEQSFLSTDILAQQNQESDVDSDIDIDPMHAGLSQWDLDNHEEDAGEREEDGEHEWEDTDAEEDATESHEHGGHLGISPNTAGQIHHENSHTFISNLVNVDPPYDGIFGDYLNSREFEELLEHMTENDSSRRGAPPASVSYVNSLPLVTIREEHLKLDSISCAICKDPLAVGSEANRLPCFHLYHRSCILPWLSSQNSCPLCRYEFPTDDKDYEKSKQDSIQRMRDTEENRLQRVVQTSYSEAETIEENEPNPSDIEQAEVSVGDSSPSRSREEGGRGRWLFLAATPIIGLVGMALVLWLGTPLVQRGQAASHLNNFEAGATQINVHAASPAPRESQRRRWWSF